MATAYTKGDALGIYHSNAHYQGGTQADADDCLGGIRSATEAQVMGVIVESPIGPITIDAVGGDNGVGSASVGHAGGDSLAYKEPGASTNGTAATIANGASVLLEGANADKWVRLSRDSATALGGEMKLTFTKPFNTAIGMDNVTNAERVAGSDTVRAEFLYNHSDATVSNIKAYVGTLGTQATTDSAQLSSSGAGTITTTDSFADWPEAGWAHIITNSPATREIVYYTSRTATSLTVPAAGRGLLGTTAAAGASTDTIDAVPGIRLSFETVDGNGDIQTVANESTYPTTGISWDTGVSAGTGLSLASLASGEAVGLWIHREVPAGATVDAAAQNKIHLQYDYDGVTYTNTISGYYRIADTTLNAYEMYIGEDAEPDFTAAPAATSSTLPVSKVITPPGSGQTEFRVAILERNEYDLVSLNQYTRKVVVASAGTQVSTTTAPTGVTVTDFAGGKVRIAAQYSPEDDGQANRATHWQIFISGDGTAPDPDADTPTYVPMIGTTGRTYILTGNEVLNHTAGPFANGSTIQVLVRTWRSSDGASSTNTTATSLTVGSILPAAPTRRAMFFGEGFSQQLSPPTLSETVYIDQGENIRFVLTPGIQDLYMDAEWVWRIKYDSANPLNNGFWTTYGIKQESISGTGSGAAEAADANTVYINVGGTRRMKIDKANNLISIAALEEGASFPVSGRTTSTQTVFDMTHHTVFQVWDRARFDYFTVASLDASGVFSILPYWQQRQTTGEFL